MNKRLLCTTGIAVLLLAACGGSDHDEPPAAADPLAVPASATASPMAYTDYVATRPADDMTGPLLVNGIVPPVSDEDEPAPLR